MQGVCMFQSAFQEFPEAFRAINILFIEDILFGDFQISTGILIVEQLSILGMAIEYFEDLLKQI